MVDESLIDREMSCLKTSLNPAFLNRSVAPTFLYLGLRTTAKELPATDGLPPFNELLLPVPPVLLRLFDIDIDKKGEVVKEMIAVVVDWDPANLDSRSETVIKDLVTFERHYLPASIGKGMDTAAHCERGLPGSGTDVNYAHEAVWYSLVSSEQVRFSTVERSAAKSLEWDSKPRLLAAFGFALDGVSKSMREIVEQVESEAILDSKEDTLRRSSPAVPRPVLALDNLAAVTASGCKLLKYHFDIDILGVRFLPSAKIDQTSEFMLQLCAFWQGSASGLQLALSPCDTPGPNIVAKLSDTEPVRQSTRRS